jgi:4-hydroxybenzoate polyprenyltransferase
MQEKLRDIILTSRPISWVNTAYPFAAGYYVSSHHIDWQLIVGTIFFLIPYNLLVYGVNDVFDYESDILNPRKGGIEGAVLDRSRHQLILIASGLTCLPFVIALGLSGSVGSKLWLVYVLFMAIAYSAPHLRFKERPFLDSFTSATHFVSPLVYAFLLIGWRSADWPYVIAFFFWAMASHAFGAVQDILADRAAGIASVGTVIGAAWTTRLALVLYAMSAGLLSALNSGSKVIAVFVLLYAVSIAPYSSLADKNAEQAHAGWQRFLSLNWLTGAAITITLIIANR